MTSGVASSGASWDQVPSMLDEAVRRRLTSRQETVTEEIRRLLDVGLNLMRDNPFAGPPRVADIVAAAGSSNDAFYRAFGSRDEFLAAIVDDGARRLLSYMRHRRDRESDPAAQVRACLEAVMRQAIDAEVAQTTRAVLACAPFRGRSQALGSANVAFQFGELLAGPMAALGSLEPVRDARQLGFGVMGEMERFLWAEEIPQPADIDYLLGVALRLAGQPRAGEPPAPVRPAKRTPKT